MTAHFTHEHDQKIAELYRAGHSTYEIAEQFEVSPTPIRRALERQNVTVRRGGPRTTWTGSAEQKAGVVSAYQNVESIRRMAKRIGIRAQSIIETLNDAGIARWHSGGRPMFSLETASQIAEAYQAGATMPELARQHNTNHITIRNYLVRQNVKLRPPGVSQFWTDERRAETCRLYKEGCSQQEIANMFGCQQTSVSHILCEVGVLTRGPMLHGKGHPSWKGGRTIDGNGYIQVKLGNDDPMVSMRLSNGYVLEHRLLMARKLGRPLTRSESVHHKNGDRLDNEPENLQLRQGKHGKGVRMTCQDCGSANVIAVSL